MNTASEMRNQVVGEVGEVYLVCFGGEHLGNMGNGGRNSASHYIGWAAPGAVGERIAKHRAGRGASLLRAATQQGIEWDVVRTWEGVDRNFERRLKNRGSAKRICPNCNPDAERNGR